MIKIDSQFTKKVGNITAAFGADLLASGSTCIPNLLLNYYKKMDLSDSEMMLLIHIIKLRAEKNVFPTIEELGRYINGGEERARTLLSELIKKGILSVTSYYDFDDKSTLDGLDFEPLYEKLSELWACDKVKEIEAAKNILEKNMAKNLDNSEDDNLLVDKEERDMHYKKTSNMDNICMVFEREFARPLSPMEVERIRHWLDEYDVVLVMEALRRAVLMGKINFRYIDAILLEWSKNNLTTLSEIAKYEENFQQQRRMGTKQKYFLGAADKTEKYTIDMDEKKEKAVCEQKEKHKKIFNALLMS
ncbi:DnaD domain protein [Peptococcaceae bacterium]|nr:DnaD domain protein [Peptococcaceae bacterium]